MNLSLSIRKPRSLATSKAEVLKSPKKPDETATNPSEAPPGHSRPKKPRQRGGTELRKWDEEASYKNFKMKRRFKPPYCKIENNKWSRHHEEQN